jgi:hypothetical protein
MSDNIHYKKISRDEVCFGYYFSCFVSLVYREGEILSNIKDYCDRTNKDVSSKIFVTEVGNYILEIKVRSNGKSKEK